MFRTIFFVILMLCGTLCGKDHGLLIVFMGLPGCGKSSVCVELAAQLGAKAFLEPEEKEWPKAVLEREQSGNFTMLSWFRSIRVPLLFEAFQLRNNGEIAIVDSYYDKLLYGYIEDPQMNWLISPKDPYFNIEKEIARQDWDRLPDADVLVFFDLDQDTWFDFLKNRNRKLDQDEAFRKSYNTQRAFLRAAQKFTEEKGRKIVILKQDNSSPKSSALRLKNILTKEGLIQ